MYLKKFDYDYKGSQQVSSAICQLKKYSKQDKYYIIQIDKRKHIFIENSKENLQKLSYSKKCLTLSDENSQKHCIES